MARLDKNLMNFTELCLRNYHNNLHDIKRRKDYLEAKAVKSPSDFSGVFCDGGGEDVPPQERLLEAEDTDDDLSRLHARTVPITDFLSILTDEEKEFVELRYFQCASWPYISDKMHMAEITLKRNWRPKLMKRAARLLLGKVV